MVGPRTASTPLRRASTSATLPYRRAIAGSHDDDSAVAEGRFSDGSRSSQRSPRTPDGPSDTTIDRSPISSSGHVDQKSRPVSSCTLRSSDRRPTRSATRGEPNVKDCGTTTPQPPSAHGGRGQAPPPPPGAKSNPFLRDVPPPLPRG